MPKKAASKKAVKEDADGAEVNYEDMTVVQLKKLLGEKGLSITGRKADLVERLKNGGDSDEEEEAPKPAKKAAKKATKKKAAEEEEEEEEDDEEEEKSTKKRGREETKAEEPNKRASKRVSEKNEADDSSEKEVGKWTTVGTMRVLSPSTLKHSDTVIAFDMDSTLIEPKSGKVHPTGRSDWKWLLPGVPEKLKELHKENKKIVIFTNQGGMEKDISKEKAVCGKILDISKELGIPLQAFIATSDDQYRKPSTTMWDIMQKDYNGGEKLDLSKCVYVGDAAGRAAGWKAGAKKDFACTDRKFANNVGIKFLTPEEYFLNESAVAFEWRSFNPLEYKNKNAEITEGGIEKLTSSKQEMVIFVGFPASGKSTLAKTYLVPKGYVHVNRDTLKTKEKCMAAAERAIEEGKSVVIDNTSPTADDRSNYIPIAQEAGIPVRCFYFQVDLELANHLNYFRERITNGESKHVPGIGYNLYKKKFQEPKMSEGFSEIRKIHFVPKFANEAEEKSFKLFAKD